MGMRAGKWNSGSYPFLEDNKRICYTLEGSCHRQCRCLPVAAVAAGEVEEGTTVVAADPDLDPGPTFAVMESSAVGPIAAVAAVVGEEEKVAAVGPIAADSGLAAVGPIVAVSVVGEEETIAVADFDPGQGSMSAATMSLAAVGPIAVMVRHSAVEESGLLVCCRYLRLP